MALKILYEDHDVIVTDKPSGIPSVTDKSGDQDWLTLVSEAVGQPLFPLHRLDRPVSGIIAMAKSGEAQALLSSKWHQSYKKYIAFVEGHWTIHTGTLTHTVKKGRNNKAIFHHKGKNAMLNYRLLKVLDRYSILEITLITGRFHQIRFQLSTEGFPIKGDIKYGARRKNRDRSIHLHCCEVSIPEYPSWTSLPPPKDGLWKEVESTLSY